MKEISIDDVVLDYFQFSNSKSELKFTNSIYSYLLLVYLVYYSNNNCYNLKSSNISNNLLIQHNNLLLFKQYNLFIGKSFRKDCYKVIYNIPNLNDNIIVNTATINLFDNNLDITQLKDSLLLEIDQIKKDISRISEYNELFRLYLGKNIMFKFFEYLLIKEKSFFYIQGMESIVACCIDIFYPSLYMAQYFFNNIILNKYLYFLLDYDNKTLKSLEFFHLIFNRILAYLDPDLYVYLNNDIEILDDQYLSSIIIPFFTRSFNYQDVYKLWDYLIFQDKAENIYLICVSIFISIRNEILLSSKDDINMYIIPNLHIYTEIDEIINKSKCFSDIVPSNMLLLSNEFKEEILQELKLNSYYKDRWWTFENYYKSNNYDKNNNIFIPIITLEDVKLFINKVYFIDVRSKQEHELSKVKNSINFNISDYLSSNELDLDIHALNDVELNKSDCDAYCNIKNKSEDKLLVLIGNKNSLYKEADYLVLVKKVKHICMLQGGIDIILMDYPNLLNN